MNGLIFLIYTVSWVFVTFYTLNVGIFGIGALAWFGVFVWSIKTELNKIEKEHGRKKI